LQNRFRREKNRQGNDAELGGKREERNCDCNEILAMKNIDICRRGEETETQELFLLSRLPEP
jgi:hypothetical protein